MIFENFFSHKLYNFIQKCFFFLWKVVHLAMSLNLGVKKIY